MFEKVVCQEKHILLVQSWSTRMSEGYSGVLFLCPVLNDLLLNAKLVHPHVLSPLVQYPLKFHVHLFIHLLFSVPLIKGLLYFYKGISRTLFHKICTPFKNGVFECALKYINDVIIFCFFIHCNDSLKDFNFLCFIHSLWCNIH